MRNHWAWLAAVGVLLGAEVARAEDVFRDRVAPLLQRRCLGCHNPDKKRGGLDLSTRSSALAGGENGVVVVPGQANKSRLVQMVSGPTPRMPRTGPRLSEGEAA